MHCQNPLTIIYHKKRNKKQLKKKKEEKKKTKRYKNCHNNNKTCMIMFLPLTSVIPKDQTLYPQLYILIAMTIKTPSASFNHQYLHNRNNNNL